MSIRRCALVLLEKKIVRGFCGYHYIVNVYVIKTSSFFVPSSQIIYEFKTKYTFQFFHTSKYLSASQIPSFRFPTYQTVTKYATKSLLWTGRFHHQTICERAYET